MPRREGRLAGAGVRSGAATSPSPGTPAVERRVEQSKSDPARRPRISTAVPDSVWNDKALNADIATLPANYSFEVHKTVHRIRTMGARRVALQLPEGLLMYANILADIIRNHCSEAETIVLGDVTYGACCVDDYSAKSLGADLLVHYGHSCLVPVQSCSIPMLYIFVHIGFDATHLVRCVQDNFEKGSKIALAGTIQFVNTIHAVRDKLAETHGAENIIVPQARPLSPGELLGCTSPKFDAVDALIYVADGRFHLESAMIANPTVPAYRYDPYAKTFTQERYEHDKMLSSRRSAVQVASTANKFGIILGTLGRQGSPKILERIRKAISDAGKHSVVVLMSEITPMKLDLLGRCSSVDAWVQIACPRLSIDWGHGFGNIPLLTPYELFVAVGAVQWKDQYPMDFYAKKGGIWSNYYKETPKAPA